MPLTNKYGEVPEATLRLLKRYRVSAKNYQLILDKFGRVITPWVQVEAFIINNVPEGSRYYKAPRYY